MYAKGIEAGVFQAISTLQRMAANAEDVDRMSTLDEAAEEIIEGVSTLSVTWKTINHYFVETTRLERENEALRKRIAELENGSQ